MKIFFASLKSLKKRVRSGCGSVSQRSGSGSAPKCHGSLTLVPSGLWTGLTVLMSLFQWSGEEWVCGGPPGGWRDSLLNPHSSSYPWRTDQGPQRIRGRPLQKLLCRATKGILAIHEIVLWPNRFYTWKFPRTYARIFLAVFFAVVNLRLTFIRSGL
jgi:hypothetical protein